MTSAFAQVTPPECPVQPCGNANSIAIGDRVAAPGSVIELAIKVSTQTPINGLDLTLSFPLNAISPRGNWVEWWYFCNGFPIWADYTTDSTYRFALASANSFCVDAPLIHLRFRVNGNTGDTIPLGLSGTFNDTIVPQVSSGSIIVGPAVLFGDDNGDGVVTVMDVVGQLQLAMYGGGMTTERLLRSDVNGNGVIDFQDAYLTIYRVVNPSVCFPVEDCYGWGKNLFVSPPPVTLEQHGKDLVLRFAPRDTITNGELVLEVPNGVEVEQAGANTMALFSREGNRVKVGFIGNNMPIVGEPILILRGAAGRSVTVTGKVNQGIPIGEVSVVTGVEEQLELPKKFTLEQNYPNPFNPTTKIAFELPRAAKVHLGIYNMLGQQVVTLVDDRREAGRYEVMFDGANVPSGVYAYRLRAGEFTETKKMILTK
ncbi:MAG: T9SS type A sorting domain-containing protein [Patescibacteria group bacterium]